ncbi:hypothetical protein NQ317_005035 [Molorchus minor]|uniref:Fatty acyl-CoA reductase n=1 Tax=Molorchus minor TaxID=1323400 RepID=A0ABQ9JWW4_9CUCU|nr:hypothetical protein NQ317_005035 [Molorchus minor]
MLRPKRGKDIAERLEEIKKNQVFEVLLKDKSVEEVFSGVKVVAGDVGEENLGLSPTDRKAVTGNVNVIFHSAATLDFGDTLKATVDINLLGTRRVVQLAKECSNLSALVHVSSAYVNSYRLEADEVIYPLKTNAEDIIALVNKLSPEELEEQTPSILGDHPNTYTITKHMAEHEVQKAEQLFPCTIVRPSMIVGAWKEPTPGWTISKNGPQGFLMGAAKGVIRRLPVGKELIYDYIPVDTVVNNLLTAGFYAGVMKPKTVTVFHSTSSTRNPFRWLSVEDKINDYLHTFPLMSAVWYPHLKLLPSIAWYKISTLFIHIFPAIILDTVTKLSGGRPILMKLHRNVNTSLARLEKFIFYRVEIYSNENDGFAGIFIALNLVLDHSHSLCIFFKDWLSGDDKTDFNLDISSLVWQEYFNDLTLGARVYLNKESVKNLSAAKTKDKILYGVHIIWQVGIFSLIWYLFACITGMTMSSSMFVLPVLFILYNLL